MADAETEECCIVPFTGVTIAPQSPALLLERAKSWGMEHCIVVGEDADGNLVWGGSFSLSDRINWLLDAAKRELFQQSYVSPTKPMGPLSG